MLATGYIRQQSHNDQSTQTHDPGPNDAASKIVAGQFDTPLPVDAECDFGNLTLSLDVIRGRMQLHEAGVSRSNKQSDSSVGQSST